MFYRFLYELWELQKHLVCSFADVPGLQLISPAACIFGHMFCRQQHFYAMSKGSKIGRSASLTFGMHLTVLAGSEQSFHKLAIVLDLAA